MPSPALPTGELRWFLTAEGPASWPDGTNFSGRRWVTGAVWRQSASQIAPRPCITWTGPPGPGRILSKGGSLEE
jgi:hypothetical protein